MAGNHETGADLHWYWVTLVLMWLVIRAWCWLTQVSAGSVTGVAGNKETTSKPGDCTGMFGDQNTGAGLH